MVGGECGDRGRLVAVAGLRPAAVARPPRGGGLRVVRVDGHVRTDGHDISDAPLGQAVAEVGVLPVAGVCHHRRRDHPPPGQFIDAVQGQAPLLPVPDLRRDPGLASADRIVRPLPGHE